MASTIDLRGLVRPQLVEATKREDNPNVAEFRLQPLERGFGHTLGNAMRRMLLSSLRGAAVWGVRIDGVVHEHQTIPGVVEDVHQIIGNLKTLTLVLAEDVENAVLHIQKGGPGAVTAADITPVSGVQAVDAVGDPAGSLPVEAEHVEVHRGGRRRECARAGRDVLDPHGDVPGTGERRGGERRGSGEAGNELLHATIERR